MAYLLLTGATGLLGRYLLRDLLLADVPVAVLVRPTRRASARQRVESVMRYWDEQVGRPLPRPVILQGDICEPSLGLNPREMGWLTHHCESFLHNAASLSFISTGPESEPWRSNLHGTKNVLEVCRAAGIRKFHHMSTAYVCGQRTGRIFEHERDVGQKPGNDYERSKLLAETLVHEADFLDQPTFYRPSIIVGDSQTGYTTTFHGFYAPLQLVQTLARTMAPNETGWVRSMTRMTLNGHETKNFVPVEWVSAVTAHILTRPELHGKTYHLTPRHKVTMRLIRDVLEQASRHYAVTFVGHGTKLEQMAETERLFADHMQVYDSYWRDDPTFDTTNTQAAAPHLPCPHVDRDMLMFLARWASETNFGGTREKPVEPDFDAHQHLSPLVAATDPSSSVPDRKNLVGLRVDGFGGGQWHLQLEDGQVVAADVGLDHNCSSTYHLNIGTFASISRGELTAAEACQSGALQITGNGLARPTLVEILQNLASHPV